MTREPATPSGDESPIEAATKSVEAQIAQALGNTSRTTFDLNLGSPT